jgi:hypothetical protein
MYSEDNEPLFPFNWTTNPRLIKGAVYERLSEFERDTVVYLESLNQMSPRDLLDAEGAPAVLDRYLSKFLWSLSLSCLSHFLCNCFPLYPFTDFNLSVVEEMSTLTHEQRMKFLEKARAKKAQPEEKVDALSQLEVGEGDKKKRKTNDARISIPVRASSAGDLAADKSMDAGEVQIKSPVKKKTRASKKAKKDAEIPLLEEEERAENEAVEEVS